jgi:hypothetical protein
VIVRIDLANGTNEWKWMVNEERQRTTDAFRRVAKGLL